MRSKTGFLAPLLVLGLAGCAGMHKKTATGIVVASDRYTDDLADKWYEQTSAAIKECREEMPVDSTAQERLDCIEPYSPQNAQALISAVKVMVAVQLAVKAAAECEEIQLCAEEVDWNELAEAAAAAWADLRPFVMQVESQETKVY